MIALRSSRPLGCLSDHSCVIVSTLVCDKGPKRPFKFYNMWTLHNDFQSLVADSWGVPILGNAQYTLKGKLVRLKGWLKELDQLHFQHILEQAKRAKEELAEAQQAMLGGGVETDGVERRAALDGGQADSGPRQTERGAGQACEGPRSWGDGPRPWCPL